MKNVVTLDKFADTFEFGRLPYGINNETQKIKDGKNRQTDYNEQQPEDIE